MDIKKTIPAVNTDMHYREVLSVVLKWILIILNIFGIPAVLMAAYEACQLGQAYAGLLYILCFLPVFILLFIRKRAGYQTTAIILIMCIYLIGLSNIIMYGFSGAGIPLFFCVFIFATVFFSLRCGFISIAICLLPVIITGFLMVTGKMKPDVDLMEITRIPVTWVTASIVLMLPGTIMIMTIGIIQKNLLKRIFRIQKQSADLEELNARLNNSLNDKEILISELYHRTGNNIQVMTSLLRLESRKLSGNENIGVFKEVEEKISAIGLVHKKLYQGERLSHIGLKDYIMDLAYYMSGRYISPGRKNEIAVEGNEIDVLIDTAVPLGMVMTELLHNSFKHAFGTSPAAVIKIHLSESDSKGLCLCYEDNGCGMPPDFDFKKDSGMGLPVVFDIIEKQLRGSIRFESGHGIRYIIEIKEESYSARI